MSGSGRGKKSGGAAQIAAEVVAGEADHGLDHYIRELSEGSKSGATQAARVIEEVVAKQPQLAAPYIAKLVRALNSPEPRVVQACANSLPELARVAPAKVARHLATLCERFADRSETAQDGCVRTFVALCTASIAYQKRLIDVLEQALDGADDKTLARWTELVLPALKGEPHARAREIVEGRLSTMERTHGQKIADFLGIRLRPSRV